MNTTGRRLADLIEHGKAAIRKSEQEAPPPTRQCKTNWTTARDHMAKLAADRLRSDGTDSEGVSTSHGWEGVEELAVQLMVLSRTYDGDQAELRLELLKTIESFIISISKPH